MDMSALYKVLNIIIVDISSNIQSVLSRGGDVLPWKQDLLGFRKYRSVR